MEDHEALDALIDMPLAELGELIDETLTRLEVLTSVMTAKASQDGRRVRALIAEAKAPTRACDARGICKLPYGHPGDHQDSVS